MFGLDFMEYGMIQKDSCRSTTRTPPNVLCHTSGSRSADLNSTFFFLAQACF